MQSEHILKASILIVSAIVLLGFAVFVKRVFFYDYLSEVILVEKFDITHEWKAIGDADLLEVKKEVHYVSLVFERPFEVDVRSGIKMPNGSIVKPDIKIEDNTGKEHLLNFTGSRGYKNLVFAKYRLGGLPINSTFSKVWIRCDTPIQVKQVRWTGYDIKDLP